MGRFDEPDTDCKDKNCEWAHKEVHCHNCKELHMFHLLKAMLYTCQNGGRRWHSDETLHKLKDGTWADAEQGYRWPELW